MTAGMIWQTLWSLVLGFSILALLQATVKADDLRAALGRRTAEEFALASAAGAAKQVTQKLQGRGTPTSASWKPTTGLEG